jgi:hypothetical protein
MRFSTAIVSTKQDLIDLRSTAVTGLESAGFHVAVFDDENYPYLPNQDQAARTVDLAGQWDITIVIVDKAYGQTDTSGRSTTEREWHAATDRHAVVIPCIRDKTFDEFQAWRKQGKPDTWKVDHVLDLRVLKFVDLIRDQPDYPIIFSDAVDLINKVMGKLQSFTGYFLKQLSSVILENVLDRRTITVIDRTLSLGDVLTQDLYISPPFRIISGRATAAGLEDSLVESVVGRRHIMLTGQPGAGKSSTLANVYRRKVGPDASPSLQVLLYVDCRVTPIEAFTEIDTLLEHLFSKYMDRNRWPLFTEEDPNVRLSFIFDALDEIKAPAALVTEIAEKSTILQKYAHIAGCREDEFDRLFYNPVIAGRYDTAIAINPWSESEITDYVSRKFRGDPESQEGLLKILTNSDFISRLASHPIGLVMLCSVYPFQDVTSSAQLYSEFLTKWAEREIQRSDENSSFSEIVIDIWRTIAWQWLEHPGLREIPEEDIVHLFDRYDRRREYVGHPVTRSLLRLRRGGDGKVLIDGIIHETISEYLMAAEVIRRLALGGYSAASALEMNTWYEINEFAQQIMTTWSERQISDISDKLIEIYDTRIGDVSDKGLLLRNKACFFIGRLGRYSPLNRDKASRFLDEAWSRETAAFVRQAIGFARAMAGRPQASEDFVSEMAKNQALDAANRGYHLVYYGDVSRDVGALSDDGRLRWDRTRKALFSRLSDEGPTRIHSRVIDGFTVLRFFMTRNITPTDNEREIIAHIQSTISEYDEDARSLLSEIFGNLIAL